MNLKDTIFSYFGQYQVVSDINKDTDGKGTLQRYNESVGAEYDEYLAPLQEELLDNNLVPSTAYVQYLPYLTDRVGSTLFMGSDDASKRRVLKYIHRWYSIKGTIRAYQLQLGMLGFTVDIVENFSRYTFDSPTTFDDPVRRFDMSCRTCGDYYINLTGTVIITPEIVEAIFSIIKFNEPIHAHLKGVTYNGGYLVQVIISVTLDTNGDLVYGNTYDPSLILTLVGGDLVVNGNMASHYSIAPNGDLIFTI